MPLYGAVELLLFTEASDKRATSKYFFRMLVLSKGSALMDLVSVDAADAEHPSIRARTAFARNVHDNAGAMQNNAAACQEESSVDEMYKWA